MEENITSIEELVLLVLGGVVGFAIPYLISFLKKLIGKGEEYVENTETKIDDKIYNAILESLREALKNEKSVSGVAAKRVETEVVKAVDEA
jgi:hypothetical protein